MGKRQFVINKDRGSYTIKLANQVNQSCTTIQDVVNSLEKLKLIIDHELIGAI